MTTMNWMVVVILIVPMNSGALTRWYGGVLYNLKLKVVKFFIKSGQVSNLYILPHFLNNLAMMRVTSDGES